MRVRRDLLLEEFGKGLGRGNGAISRRNVEVGGRKKSLSESQDPEPCAESEFDEAQHSFGRGEEKLEGGFQSGRRGKSGQNDRNRVQHRSSEAIRDHLADLFRAIAHVLREIASRIQTFASNRTKVSTNSMYAYLRLQNAQAHWAPNAETLSRWVSVHYTHQTFGAPGRLLPEPGDTPLKRRQCIHVAGIDLL